MSGWQSAACLLLSLLCAVPLHAQFSVADLSQLRDYESHRTSSFDRSGGNGDYQNLKAGGELVLFDEPGPAEIRHIWITMDDPEAYHLKKNCPTHVLGRRDRSQRGSSDRRLFRIRFGHLHRL